MSESHENLISTASCAKLQLLQDTHSLSEHAMKSKDQMITNHLSNELYGKTKYPLLVSFHI